MSRKMLDRADLIAGVDLADLAGVTASAVGNWRIRHEDFPAPVVTVGRGNLPIYSRLEVIKWLAAHRKIVSA